ncbi:7-cyano-7-deazaguanine synthase in queuosine biosynthesis [Dyella sp. SG562]|uniref:7-cyano-7-deazaguanine synthase n=1 Tax=Dyella sp. SG562 TaxID=2587017 RepID=UPI001422C6CA|nr:7-cyano-7-deazaguanine synthase [Dyella sp. SG562]NII73977.1 7-cyano-7-deazaguanine synthase in queuosine biosynthesis [Dyella sp. SG562]
MRADPSSIQVQYDAGRVSLTGAIEQDVVITTQRMLHQLMETATPRAVDLISIATGTYAIDRVILRTDNDHQNECGLRTLRIKFEVWDHAFWSQAAVKELLTDVLWHLTGDTWLLSFSQRPHPYQTTTHQGLLQLGEPHPTRVALYSGGLDSAAGLANRLIDDNDTFMLLTVGHQSSIRSNSIEQVGLLSRILNTTAPHHASFMVKLIGGVAGNMKYQEKSQRARGFLFYATAATLADACGVDNIEVFENGVGAINLPLCEGGLVDGLSTRGAQPGILKKISQLVGLALDRAVCLSLPFLHSTKAEMLAPLKGKRLMIDWLTRSRSCIHSSLRISGKRHCGHCAACIERRQAFHAAGIVDDPRDYVVDLFNSGMPKELDYLLTYLENARAWAAHHPSVRSRLERHRILSNMTHLPLSSMEDLMMRHALETLNTYGHFEVREAA